VLGIGMGGEWASGAVLVSETWPAHLRNKAISIMQSGWALGYMLASISAADHPGRPVARRGCVAVALRAGRRSGLLTLWIRRYVREPRPGRGSPHTATGRNPYAVIFGPGLLRRSLLIIALGSAVQFANWGLFFWLPTFLARPVAQGGAGMGIVGSLPWIIPVQLGAYFGYLTFGFIADRIGRRQAFVLYTVAAAVLVPIYGQMARSPLILLALGPLIGYFGYGYFSMFGGFVAELFPAAVRATGQGTTYNIGRMAGAVAPFTIGVLATQPGVGIGLAPQHHVRLLPARGGAGLHAARSQRAGARCVTLIGGLQSSALAQAGRKTRLYVRLSQGRVFRPAKEQRCRTRRP
jgi:MFS family permease